MRLYIKGKENGRMMLNSIDNGPLVYGTIKENGVPRLKKYEELTDTKKLQDDCDVKATNIILQDSSLTVPSFLPCDDPITRLNKAMAFLTTATTSRYPTTNNQLRTSSNPRNQATIQDGRFIVQQVQGRQEKMLLVQAQEAGQLLDEEQLAFLANPGVVKSQDTQPTIIHNVVFQIDDLDAFDSDCDEAPCTKVVHMANLSSYDSNVISEDMTTNFRKLDKFEGHDFRRWQKKMYFSLTTLKVVYVLTTPMPELLEDATVEAIRIRAKWENDDYICRGHILNGMFDSLFDLYTNVELTKELWDSLESKYLAEDSSSKKFLVSNFNNYKMVDSRPVMEQYNELLRILG
nr:zinc finger, CCHC-type [Tanacetum cinerariifolium]